MSSTIVPFARSAEAIRLDRADRTAERDLRGPFHSASFGMVEVRTWPTRDAMARTIRRDERRAPFSDWRPVVPLGVVEGY